MNLNKGCVWFAVVLVAVLSAVSVIEAKTLYKYQDESGEWRFTDMQPSTDQPVTVTTIEPSSRERKVVVTKQTLPSGTYITVTNGYQGPIQIKLEFTEAVNVRSEPPLPATVVIGAGQTRKLAHIVPDVSDNAWRFRYKYHTTIGDPTARHHPQGPYALPFEQGKRFKISQAFNGSFSHNTPPSQYAVDFAMPEGTAILAARAGVVMAVERDFISGGDDRDKYGEKANFVQILHEDGTFAMYAHLRPESITVLPGSRVEVGAVIGYSGSTGFSSGPHLHFVVQRNTGMKLVSEPITFKTASGTASPNVKMVMSH